MLFLDKILLMLQSLKRAHKIDPQNPRLHTCLVRFNEGLSQCRDGLDPVVKEVLDREVPALLCSKGSHQLNSEYLEAHSNRLEAVLEAAKIMYWLDQATQSTAISLVTKLDNNFRDLFIEVG